MSIRFTGTLRVHPSNPRYLTDGSRRAIYLTRRYHWYVLQDHGSGDPPEAFPFGEYLDFTERHGHTFLRMWCLEKGFRQEADGTLFRVAPSPWQRTGPARIADGGVAFDLTRLNGRHFERLRERVTTAGDRGIAVAVMLFDSWSIGKGPWSGPLESAILALRRAAVK